MNPNVITTTQRSLHGELAGMLRSAWRQFAVQAERDSRHRAGCPAPWRDSRSAWTANRRHAERSMPANSACSERCGVVMTLGFMGVPFKAREWW